MVSPPKKKTRGDVLRHSEAVSHGVRIPFRWSTVLALPGGYRLPLQVWNLRFVKTTGPESVDTEVGPVFLGTHHSAVMINIIIIIVALITPWYLGLASGAVAKELSRCAHTTCCCHCLCPLICPGAQFAASNFVKGQIEDSQDLAHGS